jgi:3-oxoadipate enol-lactonase
MSFVKSANARLFYRWDGPEGLPTLLLSNSLGSTLAMWDPQIPEWSAHFRVLRYDTRGHGSSDVTPGPYDLAQLGRDAVALLDALELKTVSFCGLSLGGMVGMWLASSEPHRLDRLVLCNTAAQLGNPDLWNSRIEAVRSGGMAEVADTVIERWFTPAFRQANPPVIDRIRDMLLGTPPEGYASCAAAIRDMDLRGVLSRIVVPTLVVTGSQDPATPPEHGRFLAENIRGARMVEFETAHLSNIEAAPAFTRTVLNFLTAAV